MEPCDLVVVVDTYRLTTRRLIANLLFLAHIDYNDIMKTMKAREGRNIKKKVRLILLSIDTCSY